jgi:hypothetical protein
VRILRKNTERKNVALPNVKADGNIFITVLYVAEAGAEHTNSRGRGDAFANYRHVAELSCA